jgi:integrase
VKVLESRSENTVGYAVSSGLFRIETLCRMWEKPRKRPKQRQSNSRCPKGVYAQKMREVPSRLARRHRQEAAKSVPNAEGSPGPPSEDAPGGNKKRGGPATVAQVCIGWAEAQTTKQKKAAALSLAKLLGSQPLSAIRADHLEALGATWRAKFQSQTVYAYTLQLKRLIAAIRPDLLSAVPRAAYRRQQHAPITQPGDLTRLMAAASPYLRALLAIASQTGMRLGDCCTFARTHCDQELTTLTLETGKTKTTIRLPISPLLRDTIENAPAGDPAAPILDRYAGFTPTRATLYNALNAAKRRSGVNREITFHSFRHTMAVSLYDVSKDIRVVQEVLGHESLATTARYLEHHDPKNLRPLLAQLWTPKGRVQ